MRQFNTEQVSSKKFFFIRLQQYTYFMLFATAGFLLGNGRTRSILDNIEASLTIKLLVLFISIVFFILWISKLFSSTDKHILEKILFDEKSIQIGDRVLIIGSGGLESVDIYINMSEYKNTFTRKMKDGANNWIAFKGKKFEFFIPSKEKESVFMEIVDCWKESGCKVDVFKAKQSLLDKFTLR